MFLHEDEGALAVAFLICVADDHDVPVELDPRSFERDDCHELDDPMAFHVEGAPAIDVAVLDLSTERIDGPLVPGRRNYIHVVHQGDGLLPPGAPNPRVEVGPPRPQFSRIQDLPLDSLLGQDIPEPVGSSELIAGRVGAVDPDVVGEKVTGFLLELVPVKLGLLGMEGRCYERNQEEWQWVSHGENLQATGDRRQARK